MSNKIWILALGLLMGVTACHTTEILDRREEGKIVFRTTVANATKATGISPEYLKTQGFHVAAFDGPVADEGVTMEFEMDLGGDQYREDGYYVPYFWGDKTLHFYAWYPKSEENALVVNKSNGYAITYTPAASAADQKDFSVAYNTGNKEDNGSTGVNMNFRHALSQVEIVVNNGSTAGNTVIVKGVKVGNAIKSGTFTMPVIPTEAAATEDNLLTDLWSGNVRTTDADKNIKTYSITHSSPISIASGTQRSVMGAGGNWMMVPQKATEASSWNPAGGGAGDKMYMALLVKLMQGATTVFPHSETPAADKEGDYAWTAVPIPADASLESGKKYTFTLTFIINTGNAGNLISNGKEVLSHPIKLVVSVDDWVEVDGLGQILY